MHVVDARVREGRLSEHLRASLCSGVSLAARVKTNGELAGFILAFIKERGASI